jgi:hypothetical protein
MSRREKERNDIKEAAEEVRGKKTTHSHTSKSFQYLERQAKCWVHAHGFRKTWLKNNRGKSNKQEKEYSTKQALRK